MERDRRDPILHRHRHRPDNEQEQDHEPEARVQPPRVALEHRSQVRLLRDRQERCGQLHETGKMFINAMKIIAHMNKLN